MINACLLSTPKALYKLINKVRRKIVNEEQRTTKNNGRRRENAQTYMPKKTKLKKQNKQVYKKKYGMKSERKMFEEKAKQTSPRKVVGKS